MKQVDLGSGLTAERTRRRALSGPLDRVLPWAAPPDWVRPHAPEDETGLPPLARDTMPRSHFIAQAFTCRKPAAGETQRDAPPLRELAGEGTCGRRPDQTTIVRVRQGLQTYRLIERVPAVADATPVLAP